jgi:hypothetical protein
MKFNIKINNLLSVFEQFLRETKSTEINKGERWSENDNERKASAKVEPENQSGRHRTFRRKRDKILAFH